MITTTRSLPTFCFLFLGMLAIGCSSDDAGEPADVLTSDDGLLKYIPADSPFVAAVAEPLPDDVREALEAKSRDAIEAYGKVLRLALREGMAAARAGAAGDPAAGPESDAEDDPAGDPAGDPDDDSAAASDRRVEALIDEVLHLLTPEGRDAAGIDRESVMAVYGQALWPVLRVRLSDESRMEATLARLEQRFGTAMSTGSVEGHGYRYLQSDSNLRGVVAVLDGYLVAGLVPADPPDSLLASVLGLELPETNIAESGVLAGIGSKYGYTAHGIGFFDVARVTEVFLDDRSGLNREILAGAGLDVTAIPDVCRTELRSLAGIMPRIVGGYTELTVERVSSHAAFELRSDLASGLATLTAPVPGLGQKGQGGIVTFGMSLNPQAARDFYAARLDALEADPYECEWFADLQNSVPQGRAMLSQPLPPVIYSFRGFLAAIDELGGMDLSAGRPPTEIDARILVATDNAEALVAMGAMFSPEIAALDLKPDSQPVSLPLPAAAAQVESAHVAMSEKALALSVGDGGGAELPDMLAAPASDPAPFFSSDMDAAAYYGFLAEAGLGQDPEHRSPELEQAYRDLMTSLQAIISRISVDVHFTGRGIEVASTAELTD